MREFVHVLVLGGGLSGALTSLVLADLGHSVCLVVPSETLDGGNSALAQGGIIYRKEGDEGIEDIKALEQDILIAGHEHNYFKSVSYLANEGPEILKKILLERLNIDFDSSHSALDYTREGGHSSARIIHCADHTGKSIMQKLLEQVKCHENIKVLTNRTAIDLITKHHHANKNFYRYQLDNECVGAYVFNQNTNEVDTILANYTVMATGGVGQIFLHTTNCPASIGSGIAMAHRAGVRLDNLEYMQFHPTALYHRAPQRFLITEAMRGEGAKLVNSKGEAFMLSYDKRGDLAPRDIVAKAIADELMQTDAPCVYLDLSNVKHDLEKRFPTIYNYCKSIGIHIEKQPVPVVPAAHYFCGGVLVNKKGQTTLNRLYSVGEVSCTGLHGANRLASTSLLEALLWGYSTAKDISEQSHLVKEKLFDAIPDWVNTGTDHNDDPVLIAQDWANIRYMMWNYVGITRTSQRLNRAFEHFRDLSRHLHEFYRTTQISKPIIDLFHGSWTAYLITQAALRNKNSLGCHYRID